MKPLAQRQANSRNCFVCGVANEAGLHMRFYETPVGPEPDAPVEGSPEQVAPEQVAPVQVEAEYTVPARYQGWPGVVHGGIIASMLDEVTSRTIFRGENPRFVVTAQLSVRYRKPVPIETPLKLIGRVIKDRGRVINVAGEIRGPGDVLLADAEATLVQVDPAFFGDAMIRPEDWQVYPDEIADKTSIDGSASDGAAQEGGE